MKKLLILLVGLLLFSVGNAFAFPMWPGIGTSPGTLFQDDNRDYLSYDANNNGIIDVGDVLTAAIEFPSIEQLPSGAVYATDNDDLVAISTIELKAITGAGTLLDPQLWWFGEYDDGDDTTDDSMVQFYTGGSIDLKLNDDLSLAASIAAITDGDYLWSFSVTDDEDTFWAFQPLIGGAGDTATVNAQAADTKIGVLNYALMQTGGDDIFSYLALDAFKLGLAGADGAIGDGLVDMTGSGDILGGGGLIGGAFARSDIDSSVNPIPEPATLSLFGFSLLGLAFVSRRRKS